MPFFFLQVTIETRSCVDYERHFTFPIIRDARTKYFLYEPHATYQDTGYYDTRLQALFSVSIGTVGKGSVIADLALSPRSCHGNLIIQC